MIRILVIDTDPGERLILRSRLSDQGYEVHLADTGAKGLVEARSENFDLILLSADLSEGVDGAEVCRRLKAIPRRIPVPVVMYSHETTTHEGAERVYDAGCDHFVGKGQMASLDRVLRVMLTIKSRFDELGRENRMLEHEVKNLQEQRSRDQESVGRGEGSNSLLVRELAASRPDGLIVVDTQGSILHVDRGACELFGARIEGKTLGQIAPGSGLEAFVRDARTQAREQFRFDVRLGKGRADRSLMASVVPVASSDNGDSGGIRVVLLLDVGRRRLADEVLRHREAGIPRLQLSSLLEAARATFGPQAILGATPEIVSLRRRVIELMRREEPLLLRGERGTGKGFVANVLHYGGRATSGMWSLRCSALTPENLELELFGQAEAAGSSVERPGLCQQAGGGTLYLIEIADLPLEAQEQLLHVLESGSVTRKGANKPEKTSFRLIASTERDLSELVRNNRFSSGLYAKLAGCVLELPPLRNVIADLPLLVEHFLRVHSAQASALSIDEHALWLMQRYNWPGNVAELQDCIEEACRRAKGEPIALEHLTRPLRELEAATPGPELIPARPAHPRPLGTPGATPATPPENNRHTREWEITDEDPISLDHYEKKALMRALDTCGGDKLAAARLLKVGKSTLYRKLKRLGIT